MNLIQIHDNSVLYRDKDGKAMYASIRRVLESNMFIVRLNNTNKAVYLNEVTPETLTNAFIENNQPVVTITYDLEPKGLNNPNTLPVPKAALPHVTVVDNYIKINKDVAKALVNELTGNKQVRLIESYVNGDDFKKGLKGARYHSKFREVVIIAQHDVTQQVKHYLSKGTKVWLVDINMNEAFELPSLRLHVPTMRDALSKVKMFKINEHNQKLIDDTIKVKLVDYTNYQRERKNEFKLEAVLQYHTTNYTDIPREQLEQTALTWSKALGYQFSRPIADRQSTFLDNQYEQFEILPYAGAQGYYFKGYYVEKTDTEGRKQVKINNLTKLRTRLGTPTEELEQFYEFYQALVESNTLELCLEPGYELCTVCNCPVYVSPENDDDLFTEEDVPFCKHCGYEARPYTTKNGNIIIAG